MTELERARLEANLEAFFRKRVRLVGGYTIKLAPTEAGVPDRLAIFPGGRMYLVELKRDDTDLSPIQRVWHERLRLGYGVKVYTLHGREGILAWLRQVVSATDVASKRGRPATKRVG